MGGERMQVLHTSLQWGSERYFEREINQQILINI